MLIEIEIAIEFSCPTNIDNSLTSCERKHIALCGLALQYQGKIILGISSYFLISDNFNFFWLMVLVFCSCIGVTAAECRVGINSITASVRLRMISILLVGVKCPQKWSS